MVEFACDLGRSRQILMFVLFFLLLLTTKKKLKMNTFNIIHWSKLCFAHLQFLFLIIGGAYVLLR